jgi:hypothetical protein
MSFNIKSGFGARAAALMRLTGSVLCDPAGRPVPLEGRRGDNR